MKVKLKAVLIAAGLALATQASAQDSMLEYVVGACEGDLEQYCSQVTPGEGRLLHCVAAHEDKLSGQCEYALYQAASLLEQLSVAEAGEGRILACLEDNAEQVGETCKQAIADTVGE
jgi:hypothetical protein